MSIMRTDVGTLAVLQAILASASLSIGARRMGISQPAASNALARMRKITGDPLIVRSGAQMSPTARGIDLLEQLNELLPRLEALAHKPEFLPAEARGMLPIAASDHASLLLLPEALKRIRAQAPNLRISVSLIQPGGTASLEMERTGIEMRLGWMQSLPQSWYMKRLVDDGIAIIASADSPITAETIDVAYVARSGHVALATDRPYYQTLADQALAKHGIQRTVAVWTTNFTAIPLLVQNTDLIAFFPASLARMYQNMAAIKILPCPITVGEYHISMAWHPRLQNDGAYRWLREQLTLAAADLP